MDKSKPTETKYNSSGFEEGIQREKVIHDPAEKKESDRPNIQLVRHMKKRLAPPLKKDQNKEATQKPKYFGRKEEVTPKQEADNKNIDQMAKHNPIDRSKQISPLPNTNDYHTVSISQRNKNNKGEALTFVAQGAHKKQERDTRMRKKIYSHHERGSNDQPSSLVTTEAKNDILRLRAQLVKKQASPSGEKVQIKGQNK